VVFFSVFFVLLGGLWIDQPGLYEDEVLFAAAIYDPIFVTHAVTVGDRSFPTMIMTYLGTLKSCIYKVIFSIVDPTPVTIRLPMLMAGALALYLTAMIIRTVSRPATVIIVTVLLATDVSAVLTTRLDWGPVALQHLLIALGVYAVVRFDRSRSLLWLTLGFFAFGLALWDKALAIWMLTGLACAGILTCRAFVKDLMKTRWRPAVFAFWLGALPWLLYNIHVLPSAGTFQGQRISLSNLPSKVIDVAYLLRGNSLHGWAVRNDYARPYPDEGVARSWLERTSLAISDRTRRPRRAYLDVGLLCCLLLLPLVTRGDDWHLARFVSVALAGGLLVMLLTRGAGGAIHHFVLLWPLPHVLVGIVAGSLWYRRSVPIRGLVTMSVGALVLSNLLVINEFYALLLRNGGTPRWTDAIYRLADHFQAHRPKSLILLDWGLLGPLRVLSRGTLPLEPQINLLQEPGVPRTQSEQHLERLLSDLDTVFVTNVEPTFPGAEERLRHFAALRGFVRSSERIFADSNGIPVVRVFTYARAPTPP